MPQGTHWAGLALLLGALAAPASASTLAESISVSGDSISRAFDANTSSCNYGDNVSRAWATGDDHGTNYCSAGGNGTFSHAERLECAKGGDVTIFNDSASGADMLNDFANQATSIKLNLSASSAPRYVPVFMGHNDACTNTTSKSGNGCSGDTDPNNYCRTTNAAFEREFRRGMDQLIQIPSVRIGVLALVRVSELCNFGSKSTCGAAGIGGNCSNIWGVLNICASLTTDCSNQRRIDMYDTLVGYNEILERVTNEYAAIPSGGLSATGATKAPDVQIRYGGGSFNFKFASSDVSCCDCFHPDDQGQAKLAQFSWDGLQCTSASPCCAPSADPLTNATCSALDTTTFYPGGFWPGSMPCGNGILDPDEQCDDGNTVDGDCCSSTCQYEAPGAACTPADTNPCTDDVCDGAGTCSHVANTAPCNDGDNCTQNDTCHGGSCSGTAIVCSAQDQCHTAGTCNPATGQCSNPTKADGAACSDGNACTQTDTCVGGVCSGANPVTCAALDQCHVAGTCNPLSGVCSNPTKPNGTACNDGDACTQSDTCQAGVCNGTNPVVCTAQDQCHVAGTCDPGNGVCSNPARPNGTACNDGNACTQGDTCQAGVCGGTNAVVCTALDQCHLTGTCNPASGTCSNPIKPTGSTCSDGNACTQTDTCQNGFCIGANPVVCAADQCHTAGTCDPQSGACSNSERPDGTACDDADACTRTDACAGGICTGSDPVVCTALDQCHVAGTCDPGTGVCSNPEQPDGTACDDADACTRTDTCAGGICTGTDPIVCTPADQCQAAGTCDPETGVCSNPAQPDGTSCDDADACTQSDTCEGGICTGAHPVVCTPVDDCHDVGTCEPSTGVCSSPSKPDGAACDDGNACTTADRCEGGVCAGASSRCGDGVVQAECNEACDDGPGNGSDHCCSASCQPVDGDGDGLCDRDDPCTGGVSVLRPRVALGRLDTPAHDDTVAFRGTLMLSPSLGSAVDPLAKGVRLLVTDHAGTVLDVTIPAGAYASPPGAGWFVKGNGTKWIYRNRFPGPGAMAKAIVQEYPGSDPLRIKFQAKGKTGAYAVAPADLPLTGIVVLDPPAAETGACGAADFPGPRPAPSCSFTPSGASLRCH